MARPVKTFFPKTRLAEIAARGGGIARDTALEGALALIEELRDDGVGAIKTAMSDMAAVAFDATASTFNPSELGKILRYADTIDSLAGTFGYDSLAVVVRSLCDLADGFLGAGIGDKAPILVHVQSMQLMAPGGPNLSEQEAARIHAELARVVAHYNFKPLDGEARKPAADSAAA